MKVEMVQSVRLFRALNLLHQMFCHRRRQWATRAQFSSKAAAEPFVMQSSAAVTFRGKLVGGADAEGRKKERKKAPIECIFEGRPLRPSIRPTAGL